MSISQSFNISWWSYLKHGIGIGLLGALFVFLIVWLGVFSDLSLRLNDFYFLTSDKSDNIVIVALDDASFEAYGRTMTQWSRTLYADLLYYLDNAGVRAVAFDILFSEPSENDDALLTAMVDVRTSDNRTRIIMPVAGVGSANAYPSDQSMRAVAFTNILSPLPDIIEASDYLASINAFTDADDVVRRLPSYVEVQDNNIVLSFSISTYLAFLRIPSMAVPQLVIPEDNILHITPERQIIVDENGFWRHNYFGGPLVTFPVVSLTSVLEGDTEPELFDGKIVLVGVINATGVTDYFPVPSSSIGERMAGIEIHAHAIETLIRGRPVQEQDFQTYIVMIFALAVGSGLIYVRIKWHWKLIVALLFSIIFLVSVSVNFTISSEIINIFDMELAFLLPALASIGLDITLEVRRREETEFLLQSVVSITQQQMGLERILSKVAENIQTMVDVRMGAILLGPTLSEEIYVFPEYKPAYQALETLITRCQETMLTVREENQLVIPLIWQQRLIGAIALEENLDSQIAQSRVTLLEMMASRIGAGLETARLYAESEQQKLMMTTIFMNSPTGNAILDETYHLLVSNSSFNGIFHSSASTETLFSMFDVAGLDDKSTTVLKQQFNRRQSIEYEVNLQGSMYYLYATFLQEFSSWVVVLHDVTERAMLNHVRAEVKRYIAHDLQIYVGKFLSNLSQLQADADTLSKSHRTMVEQSVEVVQQMHETITAILSIEQLASTDITFASINLFPLITEVIDSHDNQIMRKEQQLIVEVDEALPLINANAQHIRQALSILIHTVAENAPRESQITVQAGPDIQEVIRIEVTTSGIGASKEVYEKLFFEFNTARPSPTGHINPSDTDLATAKTIIGIHDGKINGRVWTDTEDGAGIAFWVILQI